MLLFWRYIDTLAGVRYCSRNLVDHSGLCFRCGDKQYLVTIVKSCEMTTRIVSGQDITANGFDFHEAGRILPQDVPKNLDFSNLTLDIFAGRGAGVERNISVGWLVEDPKRRLLTGDEILSACLMVREN